MYNLGIMVNYRCNARCAHCLYGSAPGWADDYISPEKCREIAELLDDFSIPSVHIGGGEPFLHFDGLCTLLDELDRADIMVDYIETNGFWCYDERSAKEKIRKVKELRGNTLMVSCDPFHAEFVPPARARDFVKYCRECGMDYFVWHDKYLTRFLRKGAAPERALTREELTAIFGKNYRENTAAEYGLAFNGRALNLLETMVRKRPAEEVLDMCDGRNLRRMDSGHLDYTGKFLPGHCLGFGVDFVWKMEGAKEGRYPLIDLVREKGLAGLYALAREKGFMPNPEGYTTACALCMEIKKYLLAFGYEEIYPADYFNHVSFE